MLLKILILILFFFINVALAKYDSIRIKEQKRIYHGVNATVYLLIMAVVFCFLKSYSFLIALLAERRIVFDTALNLFRGLRFDYISSTTTSIIDRISYKFQAKYGYFVYYLIFLIVIVISLFLNF